MKKILGILMVLVVAGFAFAGAGPYPNKQFGSDFGKDGRSYKDLYLKNQIIFEGATDDAYEGTISATDVTADRTWTMPDQTGTVAMTSDISASSGTTNITTVGTLTSGVWNATPIASAYIADNAVNVSKIANAAVNSDKLADNAVTTDKIVANAVTLAKLADASVNAAKLTGIAYNCANAGSCTGGTANAMSLIYIGSVNMAGLDAGNAAGNVTGLGFTSTASYRCTVNNNSANRVVMANRTAGANVTFSIAANATDTVGYICIGN